MTTVRTFAAALCVLGLGWVGSAGAEPPAWADATLRAVHFVDASEGWAVGDDGVILHTIDGGQSWERQASGVRASLRGMYFIDSFVGFVVGRENLPFEGSAGVILFTNDGGVQWKRVALPDMPGLHAVHFFNPTMGFVVGETSGACPSGIFSTDDAGKTWKLVAGERHPGWRTAQFSDPQHGILGGDAGQLVKLFRGELLPVSFPGLKDRTITATRLDGPRGWAVGTSGLVAATHDGGATWSTPKLPMPETLQRQIEWHGLAMHGERTWIVGRPGSMVLRSIDRGTTWELVPTGQAAPLHSICFVDETRGWAVGAVGTILHTNDGGKTWKIQRRGGHRAAGLVVTGRGAWAPVGTLAVAGGDDGYLIPALQITTPTPVPGVVSASFADCRFDLAVRNAGGLLGETAWSFPLTPLQDGATATQMARAWSDTGDEAQGLARLEASMVLALRMWRPDVVVTDDADPRAPTGQLGALVALAVKQACAKAGRADVYPEHLQLLGLSVWTPKKLYAVTHDPKQAKVIVDLETVRVHLAGSACDHVAPVRAELLATLPLKPATQEGYRLLWSPLDGGDTHTALFQELSLERGGQARRTAAPADLDAHEVRVKAAEARQKIQALARDHTGDASKAREALAQVDASQLGLTDDQLGDMVFTLAQSWAARGQWPLARELYFMFLDRYPTHRYAPQACRWLIAHGTSSEAYRREELKQFMPLQPYGFPSARLTTGAVPRDLSQVEPGASPLGSFVTAIARRRHEVRVPYVGGLALGDVLALYGARHFADPAVQFNLQAGRRAVGQVDAARLWFTQFLVRQTQGPWGDAAKSELWLANRTGECPKPLAKAQRTPIPPHLDGVFDDPCWRMGSSFKLKDALGDTAKTHATEAQLAYDDNFIYLALTCRQPPDAKVVPPVHPRPRDADLSEFDRVTLMLDLDRDYTTSFNFHMDQRGCVAEDCWGDRQWNPKWYVTVKSEPGVWRIEAAIPLTELTGREFEPDTVWAMNLVRTIPGQGVQAHSTPAGVAPIPEGMGLLLFEGTVKSAVR
jgi:photosystem II stability/assembly factor-like uncharacterized protein